jgi:hypothetical protein
MFGLPVGVGGGGVNVAVAVAVGGGVTPGVIVGVAVTVGVDVGEGANCAQYLPPVFNSLPLANPPQTIITLPVQTAV